jgi:casein kinase II subunit alpha
MFRKEHFFRGSDNDDQLLKIMKALGTVHFDEYLKTYGIHFETDHAGLLDKCAVLSWLCPTISLICDCHSPASYPSQPWTRFVTAENQQNISIESLDLLDKLLRYDHSERLTAREAQGHAYFSKPFCPRFYVFLEPIFYSDTVRLEATSNNKESMSDSGFCSV